jgi:hypothetical protein
MDTKINFLVERSSMLKEIKEVIENYFVSQKCAECESEDKRELCHGAKKFSYNQLAQVYNAQRATCGSVPDDIDLPERIDLYEISEELSEEISDMLEKMFSARASMMIISIGIGSDTEEPDHSDFDTEE